MDRSSLERIGFPGTFVFRRRMKQFICLLLFNTSAFSENLSLFTSDYLLEALASEALRFPARIEQTVDDSAAQTTLQADYSYNLLFYDREKTADTLLHRYATGAHTWNLQLSHRSSRWQTYAAWRQHALNASFEPENDYETSVVYPRHVLVVGGKCAVHSNISVSTLAAADPVYLQQIATDNSIAGTDVFSTAFATPGIDLSTAIHISSPLISGSLLYENSSPFNHTTTIVNTANNGRRTLHLSANENRIGSGITFNKTNHRFFIQGSTGFIDSSIYTFSDNHYPVIAKGKGYHASVDYTARVRFSPGVSLSYNHYGISFRGFDNIRRSFARLNGTRFSLLNGAVSLRKDAGKSFGTFFSLYSSDNSSGSVELYPFSSWITLINLNRYYLTAARSSWREYGVFFRYLRNLRSRHSLSADVALSGSHLETVASTAEGKLAFGGLLLVKENEQRQSLDKNFILIKAAVIYRYRWNLYTPAITIQQYVPVEIKKGMGSSSSATTSSDVKRTVFGGFRISVSLSRDIGRK